MNYTWDFSAVFRQSGLLMEGLLGTAQLAAMGFAIAVPLGLIIAIVRMGPVRILSFLAKVYINFFRSAASLVLIFWFYYAFPILIDVNLTPFVAATLALSLQSSAYFAEVFRGGIQSINKGQWEAAAAIGLTNAAALRYVILPQAVKRMLPILFTRTIELIKATSLAGAIAYSEILYSSSRIIAITFRPIETYTVVAIGFFLVIFSLSRLTRSIERRMESAG